MYIKLYIVNMNNPIPISDARSNLPELVKKVNKNMDRVIITVNGEPKAILLSAEEVESLEETAEILSIPNIKKDLAKSKKQIKKGEFTPLSSLK